MPKHAAAVNTDYFEELDNKSSYWLGFLIGDSSIKKHPNTGVLSVKLGLSEKDADHLLEFVRAIESTYKLRKTTKEGHKLISVTIYDQEFVESLLALGCTRDKTATGVFPEVGGVKNHLIRGYSDADGYIGAPGGNGFSWSIASNNKNRLQQVHDWVPVDGGEIYHNDAAGTYYLKYGKLKHADSIADFLHPDGHRTEPALKRKRDAALERAAWALKKTKDKSLEEYA